MSRNEFAYSFLVTSIPCIDLAFLTKYDKRNSISHPDKFLEKDILYNRIVGEMTLLYFSKIYHFERVCLDLH